MYQRSPLLPVSRQTWSLRHCCVTGKDWMQSFSYFAVSVLPLQDRTDRQTAMLIASRTWWHVQTCWCSVLSGLFERFLGCIEWEMQAIVTDDCTDHLSVSLSCGFNRLRCAKTAHGVWGEVAWLLFTLGPLTYIGTAEDKRLKILCGCWRLGCLTKIMQKRVIGGRSWGHMSDMTFDFWTLLYLRNGWSWRHQSARAVCVVHSMQPLPHYFGLLFLPSFLSLAADMSWNEALDLVVDFCGRRPGITGCTNTKNIRYHNYFVDVSRENWRVQCATTLNEAFFICAPQYFFTTANGPNR